MCALSEVVEPLPLGPPPAKVAQHGFVPKKSARHPARARRFPSARPCAHVMTKRINSPAGGARSLRSGLVLTARRNLQPEDRGVSRIRMDERTEVRIECT